MPDYIEVPITTDPDTLADAAFAYIQSVVPGWQPNPGNIETILVEAMARISSELRTVASAVPTSIFRYYGNSLIGVPPIDDSPASGSTTWTVINNAGYTILAGTTIGLRVAGDTLIPFEVVNDVVIPPGSTATAAGAVSIRAIVEGTEGNGLTGAAELIDALDWVTAITVVGFTGGGVTAEEDADYLARLTSKLQLLSPRPILPSDFAVMAKDVAGVYRALAIDGYNPVGGTFNNERMVAVALVDAAGAAVSGPIKAAVDTLLQAEREITFVVNVIDPTVNLINVTVTFKIVTGQVIADVQAAVSAAITSYLSPANWGRDAGDTLEWVNRTSLRYLELATMINNVPGVDYITALTFAIQGNALATADVVLVGVAPLTTANTLVVTGS